MALDEINGRLERITRALTDAGVPFALIGGQAVAIWVSTRDPDAVRTTKDVGILIARADLSRARAAAHAANMDYFEVASVGMFLERENPSLRKGIHLLWAGEKVRGDDPLPNPEIDEREEFLPGKPVVSLAGLIRTKLMANRKHDHVHILDMIGVGLIDRGALTWLPPLLAERLRALFDEYRRDYEGDPAHPNVCPEQS